jgi:hypothetical protein
MKLGAGRPGSNEREDEAHRQDDDSTRRIIVKVTRSFGVEEAGSDQEQSCEDRIGKQVRAKR